eukprot:gene17161-6400_t
MMPSKFMMKLIKAKRLKPELKIYLFGDPNQCPPVEGDHNKQYKYLQTLTFKRLCNFNMIELDYVPGCARYDDDTRVFLDNYLQTRTLPKEAQKMKLKPSAKVNICLFNHTKDRINQDICDIHKKKGKKEGFEHGAFYYFKGQKVIATQNNAFIKVYNAQQFEIVDFDEYMVTIRKEDQTTSRIKKIAFKQEKGKGDYYFEPAYCVTVYRYQGDTISEPFNIWDAESMSFEEMYTALSRTKSLSQIGLSNPNKETPFPPLKFDLDPISARIKPAEADTLKPICEEKGVPFFVYRGSKLAKDEMVKQYSASSNGPYAFIAIRIYPKQNNVDVYYLILVEEKYYDSYIQRMNDFKDTLYDLKAEMPIMPFRGKGTDDTQWTNSKSGDVKVFNIVLTKEWINYRVEKYIQKDQKYGLKKGFEDTELITNMTDAFAQMEKYMPPDQGNVRDVDTQYIGKLEMYKSFLEVDSHIDYKNRSYSKEDMKDIRKLYDVSLKNDLYETPSVYADFIYNEIVSQTEEDKTYDILEPSCGLCALAIPYLFHKNYNLTLNDIAPDVIKTIKPLNKIEGVKVVESDFLEDNKITKKKIDPKTKKPKTIQIAINMFVNVVDDKRIRTLGDIEKKQEEARLLKQGDKSRKFYELAEEGDE